VTQTIEIDPQATGATVNPATKRGPRGLALNASAHLLYVLNRLYNTISIVNLASHTVTAEISTGTFDPTPTVIRNGRGFLYDHKVSGNGTGSCASCHIDAEMDLLAWNLGDPGGNMTTLQQGSQTFQFHPMKGPMTTQSLRGLNNMEPYHWRGDKPNFAAFNGAFAALLGGQPLSNADMAAFTNFINTVVYMPNPVLNLDGSLPASILLPSPAGAFGSPSTGENDFLNLAFNSVGNKCVTCHVDPGPGTNLKVRIPVGSGPSSQQPFKTPHLRNLYQKINTNFFAGKVSVNGFGFNHDGAIDGLFNQIAQPSFGTFQHNTAIKEAIEAYELCFDTGMPPAVGYSRTLTSTSITNPAAQSDWSTLQSLAAAGTIDLIAKGTIQGKVHGLLYQGASNNYETDTTGLGPFTQAQLTTLIQNGDILTIMGVPLGSGVRMGIDRELDGILDGN
jgi:hypothetical protein